MLILSYIVIPLTPIVLAIIADIKWRRGYGLALLALAVAVLDGWLLMSVWQAERTPTGKDDLAKGLAEALALFVALCLSFLVAVAGLVIAAISRQWGWFAGVAMSLLPLLAVAIDGMLPTGASPGVRNSPEFRASILVLAVFCPLVLCLIYGLSRIIRPHVRRMPMFLPIAE